MRVLFLHRSFPGQFRYLAGVLARDPANQVVFLTASAEGSQPGVAKVVYKPGRQVSRQTHNYLKGVESAVLFGQAAYRAASGLKKGGFVPDVIVSHSGWGPGMFMADVYPRTPQVGYFEWFYRSRGSSFGFDPAQPVTEDNAAEIRVKNAPVLLDLAACDAAVSPTRWQRDQFPAEFQSKISVVHDGIDTDSFRPGADGERSLPRLGLDLAAMEEVVTYVATGLEPLRGFPQFMEAVSLLQARRKKLHAVIVGEDRVEYGAPPPGGKSYKELMLERFPFDRERLHFTGRLTVEEYRRVLLASSAHIYLTYPFILSWSVLEAMACGCLVVGSSTPPVREVIEDNVNGLLADFFDPGAIAARVEEALDNEGKANKIRQRARETVVDRYDLKKLLPLQLNLLLATVRRMGS